MAQAKRYPYGLTTEVDMENSEQNLLSKYKKMMISFWLFTLVVILWGAWVRISHSGDGCGDHWPKCLGEFIPNATESKTWVEYTHRLMSGIYGLVVVGLAWAFGRKNTPQKTRYLAWVLFILMIIEAGLGALLVKKNLVTVNDSVERLIVMSLHQLNSFLLTGVTFIFSLSFYKKINFKVSKFSLLFLLICTTGAIAALSSTLFPSISLLEGIIKDFNEDSHIFLKLRILHPLLALSIAGYLSYYFYNKNQNRLALEFFAALFIGVITLLTLSPVYLKLIHLFVGHYIWARLLEYSFSETRH